MGLEEMLNKAGITEDAIIKKFIDEGITVHIIQ